MNRQRAAINSALLSFDSDLPTNTISLGYSTSAAKHYDLPLDYFLTTKLTFMLFSLKKLNCPSLILTVLSYFRLHEMLLSALILKFILRVILSHVLKYLRSFVLVREYR